MKHLKQNHKASPFICWLGKSDYEAFSTSIMKHFVSLDTIESNYEPYLTPFDVIKLSIKFMSRHSLYTKS